MVQCLFILLFFTGFAPLVLSVPRKYYLIQQGKTWSDAQAYCEATHTDLAVIESNENMVRLQTEAQRQQFSSSAWIGLYNDINSWRWSLGNEPLGSMRQWAAQEPNNRGGNQHCIGINPYGWNDRICSSLYPFVCFDDTKIDTDRYIYISNIMSWLGAQSYCRQYHTDLASARDATENSVIQKVIINSDWTWIGLFRDTWKWSDQTNFSTISWMSGKPDNALGNENCGYLNNNQAADAQCSDILPFFCYSSELTFYSVSYLYKFTLILKCSFNCVLIFVFVCIFAFLRLVITGKQQIIKVKVRANQDVNEFAVKAAILEQIKQKLKDHGMAENITVKWREQPDGKVFHKEKNNST
ncbi:C-type mannose receptor 2-like isoform X1 [Pangasianodon hypophthalmus]|uniref:C-type mannose receptor 2-like isoform X1 n=1 Tax=Pangasianodon hypophthalmus TaxID=310915 RepID=UPI0023070CB7|nr:C-type mannose receptor 2-like isoform X1 [Pangasianodon hypophthalmus]